MTDCNYERGFKAGYQAGIMAASNGARPAIMFADLDMARRFGVALGESVRVFYGDDGEIIGAVSAS